MKKIIITLLAGAMTLSTLTACGTPNKSDASKSESSASDSSIVESVSEEPQTVSLEGEWKQSNPNSEMSYQSAIISGETIEIYWVNTEEESKSLYWAGTCPTPKDDSSEFTWESVNDKEKTGGAMLASGDDTKKFEYKNGEISYEASAMGTTMTVRMTKS